MANEQNLIPINSKRAREMGKKGGAVISPKKKLAAQIRELKKKGLDNEGAKKLYQIMTDPNSSALDIRTYLQGIKAHCKNANQMTQLGQTLLQWHRLQHGEKINIKQENININVTATEILDRISAFKEKQKDEEVVDV